MFLLANSSRCVIDENVGWDGEMTNKVGILFIKGRGEDGQGGMEKSLAILAALAALAAFLFGSGGLPAGVVSTGRTLTKRVFPLNSIRELLR